MRVLHAGCGNEKLPSHFANHEELRLDIDERVNPDVVANLVDMGDIGQFQTTFCSHALEHLYPHEVDKALKEFLRVLENDGYSIFLVPDLEGLTPNEEVLYESAGGPIRAMDLFYGYRKALAEFPYMAHHTGFTSESLKQALLNAGYTSVTTKRLENHNLVAIARKQ